jgi:phosphatidylglycerophosphate synthase
LGTNGGAGDGRAGDDRGRPAARRLLGLDRSGPAPPQTLAGAPLRPWTAPNAIGFLRLALIPLFAVVELSSAGGTGALGATLFALIAWGDYADGVAARLTGQYSRLGALMDPVTDRLLVICGVAVCWRFELLARWALALLAARELAMLALGRYGMRRGVELAINWPGRLAVGAVMGALFFAMSGLRTPAQVLLYVGLALAFTASALYVRYGLRELGRGGLRGRARASCASLKLRLTFLSILPSSWPVARRCPVRCRPGASTQEEKPQMDDTFPDLGSLTDVELKDVIRQLAEEETEISYKRRILHGKIDILRAELVNRLRKKREGGEIMITGEDVQQLSDILAQRQPDESA